MIKNGNLTFFNKLNTSLTHEAKDKLHGGFFSVQELEELYENIVSRSNKYQKIRKGLRPLFLLSFLALPFQLLVTGPWFWFGWWLRGFSLAFLTFAIAFQLLYLLFGKFFIYGMEKQFVKGLASGYPDLPKERFTLNESLFSAVNCRNCGGNGITLKENKVVCEYCNTVFVVHGKSKEELKIAYIKRPHFLTLRITLLLLIMSVSIAVPGIIQNARQVGGRPVGVEMIHVVEGWSQELFESIELAQRESSPSGGFQYTGGSDFATLASALPSPERILIVDGGDFTRITYTWGSTAFENYNVTVMITFEEESGLIVTKQIFGFENFRVRGQDNPATLGLNHIENVEGWTREIFENITTATEVEVIADDDFEGRNITFVGESYFQDLLDLVDRPRSTWMNEWNGTVTATWSSTWDRDSIFVSVTITYCEETEVIVSKLIHGD